MLTDLADVLRGAGLAVVERPGRRTRGHGKMSGVRCVVLHHTAGPATGEAPSLGVVENGRPGLTGPPAQLVLGRSGTWYVVAAGLWRSGCGPDRARARGTGLPSAPVIAIRGPALMIEQPRTPATGDRPRWTHSDGTVSGTWRLT